MNQATKLENTAETTDGGVYRIPFLPIGTYVVTAELAGFKKVVSEAIQLEVNQTARVDLTLELGAVTDEVTVSGHVAGSADRESDRRNRHLRQHDSRPCRSTAGISSSSRC